MKEEIGIHGIHEKVKPGVYGESNEPETLVQAGHHRNSGGTVGHSWKANQERFKGDEGLRKHKTQRVEE